MRQSNGTIKIIRLRADHYEVCIKGLDGSVKYEHGVNAAHAKRIVKRWAAFTGFAAIPYSETTYPYWYVGVGTENPLGRGQYKILAPNYTKAVELAIDAGLGTSPVTDRPFRSFKVHGTIEP